MQDILDKLKNFIDDDKGEKHLKTILTSSKSYIWNNGLPENGIHLCVQILLEGPQLCTQSVKQLLFDCMVPADKISDGTVSALMAWFFTNYSKDLPLSISFLHWLAVMLENNLIESKLIESLISQFIICFSYTELIPSLCHVLKCIAKSGVITKRAVFIGQYFYDLPILMGKYRGPIGSLLRLFHEVSPSLLPNPPSGQTVLTNYTDEFSKSVSSLAIQKGFSGTLALKRKTVCTNIKGHTKRHKGITNSFYGSEIIGHLCNARSMKHLGSLTIRNEIRLQKLSYVIGCKEGQIYLSWKIISGSKLPTDDLDSIIPVLRNVLEICQRTRDGFPVISKAFSRYFMSWDGEENSDVVYNLISWVHFETFEELYSDILCHLVHLFFTGLLRDKIRIIGCLTDLVVNKVTRVAREALLKLISLVEILIKISLAMVGFHSSAFLLTCLRFYQYMSCLEERYMLGTWTIPPHYIVFGSFFSENPILISEVCDLVIRHNTIIYPFYVSLGIIEDFELQEEVIKSYLRDLYLFLWKGQACNTELMESEMDNMPWLSKEHFNSLYTIRNHYALKPLVSQFSSHCGKDPKKRLNDKTLFNFFSSCLNGIASVKTVYEA